jgi:hypothetical protein
MAGPTGIEPATPGLKVRCSSLTELRTHRIYAADRKTRKGFFSVSIVIREIEKEKESLLDFEEACYEGFNVLVDAIMVSIVWEPFW